jgi:signal transduction histidine kinase
VSAPGPGRTTRVLLADDSDGLRLLVRSWLSTVDDLEVVAEAANGAEAVALTDAHRPDVVVLDIAMPVMDGLEALTELHRRHPSLPVVMLSGFAERDVAEQAARRGAVAFLEKSGDLDPLVAAVRRAAAGALPTVLPPAVPAPRPVPAAEHVPEPVPAGPSWLARHWPDVAAVLLLVLLGLSRFLADDSTPTPLSFLVVVPVLVLAVRHGVRGGLLAAAGAGTAFSAWAASVGSYGLQDHLVRWLVLGAGAAVAGTACDRLRAASRAERRVAEAVVDSNRMLAQANEALARANDELERSNADLRQFGYVVSHDLAEPLRTVRAFAELLEQRCGDRLDDEGRQYLAFVTDAAGRLQALVRDLRDYTRTGSADLVLAPVALDDVLDDVRTGLRAALEQRGARLVAGPLPVVHGDRSMLGLVLQNLVVNGITFNRSPAPVVEVAAERVAGAWRLTVSDDGTGVDPADAERVFRLFTRLHTRDEHEGTGLGLAIVKRIVERHRGTVRLDPREGGGTVVTVVLPAEDAA